MNAQSKKIVKAALELAEEKPWSEITLSDIADKAELDLSKLAGEIGDKTDILVLFGRQIDEKLLKDLKKSPVEGSAHDRIFDALMRRFELMEPYKAGLKNIAKPGSFPTSDLARLTGRMAQSQGWLLAGIGLEDTSMRGRLKQNGLVYIYGRTLQTWLQDDDPGLARTMAALDRRLRDGATWLARTETPVALVSALTGLARGLWNQRRARRNTADETPGDMAA